MPELTLEQALDLPFKFTVRPSPLPCQLRPVWRMYLLALLLDSCHAGRATLEQLNVLNWAIRTPEDRETFLEFLEGRRTPDEVIVRYDPSLEHAIDFSFAEGLVVYHERDLGTFPEPQPARESYRIILTAKGRALAKWIHSTDDLFTSEREFLKAIGKKITQGQVKALFDWYSK